MANIATTPEDPQHFHVFKTEKREKKLQNQSRFELWRRTRQVHGARRRLKKLSADSPNAHTDT
jgi:hypothetical protein